MPRKTYHDAPKVLSVNCGVCSSRNLCRGILLE